MPPAICAFVVIFLSQTSAIEGLTGQLLGVGIGLLVALPLGTFLLLVSESDWPGIGRVIVFAGIGSFVLCLIMPPVVSSHDIRNGLIGILYLLFLVLGAAVFAYFVTSTPPPKEGGAETEETSDEGE